MAERITATNPETGQRYEMLGNKWNPLYSDAEDTSAIESLLISAGKNMSDLGAGAHRLVMEVAGDEYGLEMLKRKQAAEQEIFGELQRERPVSTFLGQALPGIAVGALTGGVAAGAGLGVRAGIGLEAAVSGIQGGLEYREELGDMGLNAVLGAGLAAAGGAAGVGINRIRGARAGVVEAQEALAQQQMRVQQELLAATQAGRVADFTVNIPGTEGRLALEMQQATLGQIGRRTDELGLAARQALSRPAATATGEFDRLVTRAEQLGVRLTPGQITDNASMRQLEASIGSFPLSSQMEQLRKAANRRVVNRQFGRALGLGDSVDEITPDALGRLSNELSQEFDEIGAAIGPVEMTDQMMEGLSAVQTANISSPVRRAEAVEITNNMFDLARMDDTGRLVIQPEELMTWRSDIRRLMSQAAVNGDGNLSQRLREVLDVIDQGVIDQAGPEVAARYVNARARYRLTDALESPGVIKNGNVMTGRAATVMNKRYKAEFMRGNQYGSVMDQSLLDAFDVLRISNRFGDIVGDSGTATRMSIQNMLNNPGGTLTGEIISRGVTGTGRLVAGAVGGVGTAAAISGARRGLPGLAVPLAGAVAGGEGARNLERSTQ